MPRRQTETMTLPSLLRIVLWPVLLLLVPAVAMQFTAEVTWGPGDFILAWLLLTGAGLGYHFAARSQAHGAAKGAVALAVGAALLLVWANLAVGLIGREDHPANLLYAAVLFVGLAGAAQTRLQPAGMARAMAATAGVQFIVPEIALGLWSSTITGDLIRMFAANTGFALLFAGSALLFRHAAKATPVSRP